MQLSFTILLQEHTLNKSGDRETIPEMKGRQKERKEKATAAAGTTKMSSVCLSTSDDERSRNQTTIG